MTELRDWNEEQIRQALGNDNRWFFGEKNPHIKNPTPEQLLIFYIQQGGHDFYRKTHERTDVED